MYVPLLALVLCKEIKHSKDKDGENMYNFKMLHYDIHTSIRIKVVALLGLVFLLWISIGTIMEGLF